MLGVILQTGSVTGFASSIASPIIRGAIDVFGIIWWFSIAWVMYHIIMSKVHPTPSGRGTHMHEAFERSKSVITGIIMAYAVLFVIAMILNQLGGSLSYTSLLDVFFIRPITDALSALLGV
jgi:hypothetical protein